MIGEGPLLELLTAAVQGCTSDDVEIMAEALHTGVTRYAGSQIHQPTVLDTIRIRVRAQHGQAVGIAAGNSLDPDHLKELVEQAGAVARIVQPNPEWQGFAEPEGVTPVDGFDEATGWMSSADHATAIGAVLRAVADHGWTASGTYLTAGRELAVVNTRGVASYAPSSTAFLRALPDSGVGTGYADALSHRAADIDPNDVAHRAIARCALNHDPIEVPPGEYEAIFGDLCVAEALFYLAREGFNGRSYGDGNSFLSDRLGDRVTGEHVTIWDDPTDPHGLAVATDYEGVPTRRISLIEAGVARAVTYDSATAHRAGTRSTGHAPDPEWSWYGPSPQHLFMQGGNATLDQMIAATRRGLLLTRFHYTHCPDPKRVVMTGTTRDGTFLIENGQLVSAVKNLRLTQSVPDLFDGIELLGEPRLCQDWWSMNGMGRFSYVCPPVKVHRAVFSSGTLF